MNTNIKYVGMDVHMATVTMAVRDARNRIVSETTVATHAASILDVVRGLRGTVYVAFEEGTQSAWLYDLLLPHVAKVVVSDSRKNALLKVGSKSDRIDAKKLSELLRAGLLSPVYHGQNSARTLKELVRSYLTLTEDTTRVMSRIKALYRGRAISCSGRQVYTQAHRAECLQQLKPPGLQLRGQRLYEELDALQPVRRTAKQQMLTEARKFSAYQLLRTIPPLGPVRAAILIGRVQIPNRFRTKKQFWGYCGLGLETRVSAEYRVVKGQLQRARKPVLIRGLNVNHNHDLKNVFKGAALAATMRPGVLRDFYEALLAKGIKPAMARLTLARKLAAIALTLWKKGEPFDPKYLTEQAA